MMRANCIYGTVVDTGETLYINSIETHSIDCDSKHSILRINLCYPYFNLSSIFFLVEIPCLKDPIMVYGGSPHTLIARDTIELEALIDGKEKSDKNDR